ncbi:MAG TPA: UvrD-helicase domain-containing protein, partial [Bacteroidota bacterium]|nr:UvrD-helicase domain-containing protein [Bacteroidota bacterium]
MSPAHRMKFTPHQERALSFNTHLAVTANAGSGKTQVLVERYVRALLGGVPVGEVVALTYTEKAASALRRKIAERISGALAATTDRAAIARLESIRDALPSAFIGTIHGFCARLLREYPVEAGIDAAFTMVESVDAAVMLRECTGAVVGDVFRGLHAGVPREVFMDLLRSMGRRRVLRAIERLVGKPDLLERFSSPGGVFTLSDKQILGMWEKTIHETLDRELGSPGFIADIGAIAAASSSGKAGEALDLLGRLRAGENLGERAGAYVALAGLMFTQSGAVSKRFLGKGADPAPLERSAGRLARKRKLLDPLLDPVLAGSLAGLHGSLLRDARALIALALAVVERYAARKEEDARLDFDDLQMKMR